ncbi:MAG: exodeoxyribonuclease VII small subunit [Fuerstiella sp.]
MAKKKSSASSAKEQPSIEAAMEELQGIVRELESGSEPLDVSLQKFERGMLLLRTCHQQLEQAAARIEILVGVEADGSVRTAEFDGTATATSFASHDAQDDDDAETEDGVDPASLF